MVRLTPIGKRIQHRLKELNKTQRWLSYQTGLSECMISLYCRSARFQKYKILCRIASALDVKPDFFYDF